MHDRNSPAVKCSNCGKFYNKNLGLCPFCGTILSETSPSTENGTDTPKKTDDSIKTENYVSNINNPVKASEFPQNKPYLWAMLLCFTIAQIITWFLPWTRLSTNSELAELLANQKIHYLNYLGSPANVLNNYYDIKVHTAFYDIAAFLMMASVVIIFIYFILSFSQKYSGRIKGTIASVCMIVAALFVEIYRLSLNSALENAGLNEAYTFSTSGIFVFVIILSVAAMMFGNQIQKRHNLSTTKPEKIVELPVPGDWQHEIEGLTDDILIERYHNEYEWSSGYRELCYKEIQKRNLLIDDTNEKSEKWICPECVRENDILSVICKCGYQRNFANEDPKQKEIFLNRIFAVSPECLEKKQRYFQNDDNQNIIIRYTSPATIHVFRRSEKDWVIIPQDNSYLRELMMGQGNNCMTEISIEKAKEIIGSWF
ncbi:MAG: hypothetical protein J5659_01740 [Clostridia bacterium]|nr:hypothetical protein [Clostridia bacterium]